MQEISELSQDHISTIRPMVLMEASDCGALLLTRTRCFSSGVIGVHAWGDQIAEPSYDLFWLIEGRVDLVQGDGAHSLLPDDIALCGPTRPVTCRVRPDSGARAPRAVADWLVVRIPQSLPALGRIVSGDPFAARLSGRSGAGRILLDVLRAFLEELPAMGSPTRVRLSGVLLDLLAAALIEDAERDARSSADHCGSAVLQRIQQFAEASLADSELTPTTLAGAHHISVRQLHKLFQKQGLTVAGWIRERRLEGWRRDLEDPRNGSKSVQAIAQGWGFRSSAHANRLFRAAYGITPAAYRRKMSPDSNVR
jgi:AraC-like DNA-binding protein